MFKYIMFLMIVTCSATFADYELVSETSTRLGFDSPAITGTVSADESIVINYVDSTWYFEDSEDATSTLNVTIEGTSYGTVTSITEYQAGSAAAYNDGEDFGSSDLYAGINLDTNDEPDYLYAESIILNLDLIFSFSNGSEFIGSTTWTVSDLLESDLVASIDDVSCSDSPSTAEMVIPLQTSDGTSNDH